MGDDLAPRRALGLDVDVLQGFAFSSSGFSAEKGLPLVRIRDLTTGTTETRYSGPYSDEYVVDHSDVLIGMDGDFRVVRWSGEKALLNQRVCRVRPSSSSLHDGFLFHAIRPEIDRVHRLTPQTTVRHLNSKGIRACTVLSVPMEEQRRIAEILDTIDETIQATERVIAKLELVQSGVIDRSFRRSQGVFTELGAACLGPGEYGCVAAAEQRRSGWPRYVRITDLTDSGQLRKDLDMGVSPSVAQKTTLHTGDIVFARSGATVGKTYLYDPSDGLCAFAGYLIRFRPDPTKALPEFVRWWTHSSSYWRWIKRTMREGAQPNINAQEYAKAALPLPSIEEQRVIVGAIARLDVSLTSERARWEKLRQLRSGLAADLLSGRVRTVAA